MSPRLTVFIPAYNEAANLEHCVQVLQAKLGELGVDAELLIVDDGSRDGSGELADSLAAREQPAGNPPRRKPGDGCCICHG